MKTIEVLIKGSTATLIVDGVEMKSVSEFCISKEGHAPVEISLKADVSESIRVCS